MFEERLERPVGRAERAILVSVRLFSHGELEVGGRTIDGQSLQDIREVLGAWYCQITHFICRFGLAKFEAAGTGYGKIAET